MTPQRPQSANRIGGSATSGGGNPTETQINASARTYLAIWGWLAGLMLLGVWLSELSISKAAIVLIVLVLSSIKATLVALYYMHLKFDRWLLALVALVPLVLISLALAVVYSSRLVRL